MNNLELLWTLHGQAAGGEFFRCREQIEKGEEPVGQTWLSLLYATYKQHGKSAVAIMNHLGSGDKVAGILWHEFWERPNAAADDWTRSRPGTTQMINHLTETYDLSIEQAEAILDRAMYDSHVIAVVLNCIEELAQDGWPE